MKFLRELILRSWSCVSCGTTKKGGYRDVCQPCYMRKYMEHRRKGFAINTLGGEGYGG